MGVTKHARRTLHSPTLNCAQYDHTATHVLQAMKHQHFIHDVKQPAMHPDVTQLPVNQVQPVQEPQQQDSLSALRSVGFKTQQVDKGMATHCSKRAVEQQPVAWPANLALQAGRLVEMAWAPQPAYCLHASCRSSDEISETEDSLPAQVWFKHCNWAQPQHSWHLGEGSTQQLGT